MLTGTALRTEATRLDIRGRSRMSADQLRAAILAVTAPIPCPFTPCDPLDVFPDGPGRVVRSHIPLNTPAPTVKAAPWASSGGKHKLSTRRARYSRRSI